MRRFVMAQLSLKLFAASIAVNEYDVYDAIFMLNFEY